MANETGRAHRRIACMHVFSFSIPLLICVFSFLRKEIFHEGKAVYGKDVDIFLCFYFVPYKVNIPMYGGEFFKCFFLFHTKLIFPCMQGDLNKFHLSNILVGYKWKFTFRTKPLWGFATVYCTSVCVTFSGKRKRGEMITKKDNIKW